MPSILKSHIRKTNCYGSSLSLGGYVVNILYIGTRFVPPPFF
jgi:hypothetical protein